MLVTYLTEYLDKKLPPFNIGSAAGRIALAAQGS